MSIGIKHRVYWGTHGCNKRVPHKGYCRCWCKEWLPMSANVYGAEEATARPAPHAHGKKLRR